MKAIRSFFRMVLMFYALAKASRDAAPWQGKASER